MRTRSIDVAAYLHLNGIEPEEVVFVDIKLRVREFRYRQSDMLSTCMQAFDHGAMVPAKAFAEARAEMKRRKASFHARRAMDQAVRDTEEGR